MRTFRCLVLFVFSLLIVSGSFAQTHNWYKTENVLFVMTDGLRWQEVFSGADPLLMNKENGGVQNVDALKKEYWRETPQSRRETLMPFMWNVIAKQGQVFGNSEKGSTAVLLNGMNFSYPGYSEALTGFADPRINSNDKNNNPNVTVLEWLNRKPQFRGKVAAFTAWDVFPYIINSERSGVYVNSGSVPVHVAPVTEDQKLLNRLIAETPTMWGSVRYDSLTFYSALNYIKHQKPRVFYLGLGETDEWSHQGNYTEYLTSAKRVDTYLKTLWDTVQSMPQYRNKTTLIVATDHGRGDAPEGWKHHGGNIKGAEKVWIAVMGPDTPALGERTNTPNVTQSQIAATLAELLGQNYHADVAKAGAPIRDVLGRK